MKQLVMDITEFVANPIRTGIQRVVRELIRYWPSLSQLTLARFDASRGLVPLPDSLLPLLLDTDDRARESDPKNLKEYINEKISTGFARALPCDFIAIVPELFFDPVRATWYLNRIEANPHSVFFIVYDFIPWLYPERIGVSATASLMHYVRLVREASCTAFISGQTRSDYARRIKRTDSVDVGPVLPLGADGLGLALQSFSPDKNRWVSIGAINGNKNQDVIYSAFRRMWNEGFVGELVLIGRVFDVDSANWLNEALSHPQFRHLVDAPDESIRQELSNARATIYISGVEGFGLPPVESLHAGIPVIVTAATPSIADLPENGQIRLASANVPAIMAAVRSLADDDTAARLWQEAAALQLSTWREFAHRTAEWIHESRGDPRGSSSRIEFLAC